MSESQPTVTSTPSADWTSAFQVAAETLARVNRQQFEVVGLEVDGQLVWSKTPPAASEPDSPRGLPPAGQAQRSMVSATLMGNHTHRTISGVEVHVWQRGGKYLIRGRLDGRPFGETLGDDDAQATARLRQLLTEIENGSYVRPSDARKRQISRRSVGRLTLRELVAEFVARKRQARGRQTAGDYASRLAAVLDFAEKPANLKRWPYAADIDTEFAGSLRAFLFQYRSTRNGRPGGQPRMLSERQVINILQCLRTMLHWARSGQARKLPADWVVPLTPELVGKPLPRNPLRKDRLPLEARVALVNRMDTWQFCQVVFSLVLPFRPDEAAGPAHQRRQLRGGLVRVRRALQGLQLHEGQDGVQGTVPRGSTACPAGVHWRPHGGPAPPVSPGFRAGGGRASRSSP
jgi:hypothetical protein